ncbi:MAG: hypothetical protein NC132_05815 [Corallococcus sp.]|nr:hypothetical protein [Corallococcus sp.]MCM1360047.1 hypothetical protein [Corallococcus sp.]MCM1395604.1 hypothetical protein [Corallococcus sp.]
MINFNSDFQLNAVDAGDKSISHRALILAAIADGASTVRNVSLCRDVATTAECLRVLGARIEFCGSTATVFPIEKPNDNVVLDCENSGTTARLLAGLVAGLGVNAVFCGDASLSRRPMQRVLDPLRQMGANCEEISGALFKISSSSLHGANVAAQCNSAQVKSAVLLAALFAKGKTTYTEQIPTRDHTENLLRHAGCNVSVLGNSVTVSKSSVHALDITVPNDFSSAAFLIAAALATKQSFVYPNVSVNPLRIGFLRVLKRSGAKFVFANADERFGEPVADIVVPAQSIGSFQPLFAAERDICDAIDEIPLLAVLSLMISGKHRFCAVSELKHKESDRLRAILQTAKICGQKAYLYGCDLIVESDGNLPIRPCFDGKNDHRISMCQSLLAVFCGGGSVINENFDVSFPEFLQAVGVRPLRFGLVGENVSDSLSPVLMRSLAANAGICCSYNLVPLSADVTDEQLYKAIADLDGANVTMPFKARVAKKLSCSFSSVNTVGKGIEPCSTDGYGLVQALQENGVDFVGKPLWVIGAGGASEACIQTLLNFGCKIQVFNRTVSRAQSLSQKYGLPTCVNDPVGVLSFVPACEFESKFDLPESVRFVFTADYKTTSELEILALKRGLKFVDGLQMLYHQGAKSFALWTDTEVQNDYQSFKKEILNEDTFT